MGQGVQKTLGPGDSGQDENGFSLQFVQVESCAQAVHERRGCVVHKNLGCPLPAEPVVCEPRNHVGTLHGRGGLSEGTGGQELGRWVQIFGAHQ